MKGLKVAAVLLSITLCCARANAAYVYKVIVWSYDGDPRAAGFDSDHFGHSWATYIKAWVPDSVQRGPGLNPAQPIAVPQIREQYTMSWMPASLHMTTVGSQPGTNLTLEKTIALAKQGNHRIASSGPVTITRDYFEQAKNAILEARAPGQPGRWAMTDLFFRSYIKDCIHKISDIVPTGSLLRTGAEHGESASISVLRWMVQHGWATEQRKTPVDYSIEAYLFQRYGLSPAEVGQFNTETQVEAPPLLPHLARFFGH